MASGDFTFQESIKDRLEAFFTSPSKDNLPGILEADKEYDYLDFKGEWYEKSKIARDILAFSNSGGGVIVVGVNETDSGSLTSTGVHDPLDEADLGNRIEKYVPNIANNLYSLETFSYNDVYDEKISDLTFQVLFVNGAGEKVPLVATNSGSNIQEGDIYIRRNTKSEVANYEELQDLLKQRDERGVDKETAELHEELQQLRTLYSEIEKKYTYPTYASSLGSILTKSLYDTKPNPNFPDLDYDEYIAVLIDKKKIRIEKRLGVSGINI